MEAGRIRAAAVGTQLVARAGSATSRRRVEFTPVFLAVEDAALGDEDGIGELEFGVDGLGVEVGFEVDFEGHFRGFHADAVDGVAAGEEQVEGRAEVFADVVLGEVEVVGSFAAFAGAEDEEHHAHDEEDEGDLEDVGEGEHEGNSEF